MPKRKVPNPGEVPASVRIKELEKALEQAHLQSEAYRLMIEVAEKELKIEIKKK
jgi:hypothetical protein